MADFKHPGEHVYEHVTYHGSIPADVLNKVKVMELRSDDVILATYPKSGTAWLRGIISMVARDGESVAIDAREKGQTFPLLEVHRPGVSAVVDQLNNNPSPRLIATHLLPKFLEKEIKKKHPRVVMLMRNPKDALTSYFHFYRVNGMLGEFTGDFQDWWSLVENNRLCYGDVIDFCRAWWEMKDIEGVLMLQFEELKQDHEGCVRKIAKHLGKDLADDVIKKIVHETTFENMKTNPAFNVNHGPKKASADKSAGTSDSRSGGFRKGAVADWKNHFTDKQNQYLEAKLEEKLGGTGLQFTFVLPEKPE